jgi:hypothetical protein
MNKVIEVCEDCQGAISWQEPIDDDLKICDCDPGDSADYENDGHFEGNF